MYSSEVVFHAQTEETDFKIIRFYGDDLQQCMVQQKALFEDPKKGKQISYSLNLESFEQCFMHIKHQLPWHTLHLYFVDTNFQGYVAAEIATWLNDEKLSESKWQKKSQLEQMVGHKFLLKHQPAPSDLQQIEIRNLVQFTTFEHDVLRASHSNNQGEQPIPKARWTVYIDHEQSVQHDQVLMGPGMAKPMQVQGILSVEGGCIVVRNKAGQITHVYGAQHFSAVASPVLQGNRKWVAWPVNESIS
jgi:hypothetical protein